MPPRYAQDWPTDFPLLGESYKRKSDQTRQYSCIAFAIGDCRNWWWPVDDPNAHWPANLPFEVTVENFVDAFSQTGYAFCSGTHREKGFQKIAIYADWAGTPTHAARQHWNGQWCSKIGRNVDITHPSPGHLEGDLYGVIVVVMKRHWTMARRFSMFLLRIRTASLITRCIGFR